MISVRIQKLQIKLILLKLEEFKKFISGDAIPLLFLFDLSEGKKKKM